MARGARPKPVEARLLARIEFDTNGWGCWLYTGHRQLRVNGVLQRVSRVAWRLWRGPIPVDKPHVCHHCDVDACIRPDHFFAGTDADNMLDRDRKGRNGSAILQAADIPLIRARLKAGEETASIAADYGVTRHTINSIRRGVSWRHIG